jgi:hypothetical protein
MGKGLRWPSPALLVSLIALFAALGDGVYAIGKAKRTSGVTIKVKSLPGNRLKLRSVPGNRLKPGTVTGASLAQGSVSGGVLAPNSVGGKQIDEATLGPVPNAVHAESADSATDAETALNAVNAVNATTVNGHSAGCLPGTQLFAGACWQTSANPAIKAPEAAEACAEQGGALPEALQLAAFAKQPGVTLDSGSEWSSDITNLSGANTYAVVTVNASGEIGSGAVGLLSDQRHYRCVIPLLT